jgi:hypothetical protein
MNTVSQPELNYTFTQPAPYPAHFRLGDQPLTNKSEIATGSNLLSPSLSPDDNPTGRTENHTYGRTFTQMNGDAGYRERAT